MATPDFIVGIIGNVISVLLSAAPMGTFWELMQKKSAENYDAIPYITALLCKILWAFYGTLDPDGLLIITVNLVGALSQIIYVLIYLIYAPSDKKVKAMILVAIMNIGIPGSVITVTLVAFHGTTRHTFIGVLCAVVTIGMYAAPLSVMINVVKTKSVQYMPFLLSFFLLLNATCWFTFAVIQNDHYVIISNAIGILSSSAQVIIYMIYKDSKPTAAMKSTEMKEEKGSVTVHVTIEDDGSVKIQEQEMSEEDKIKFKKRSSSAPTGPTQSQSQSQSQTLRSLTLLRESSIQRIVKTLSLGHSHSESSESHSHSGFLLVP